MFGVNPASAARAHHDLAVPDKAGIEGRVRPFHDGRHTSITNAAAAGRSPAALMARAGHSNFKTTQGYIELAGEQFREEAERAEERLWGQTSTRNRYNVEKVSPQEQRV